MTPTRWLLAAALLVIAQMPAPVSASEALRDRIQALHGELPTAVDPARLGVAEAQLARAEADVEAAAAAEAESARLREEASAAAGQITALEAARQRSPRDALAEWLALLPDEEPIESAEDRLERTRSELEVARQALSRTNLELGQLLAAPAGLIEETAARHAAVEEQQARLDAVRRTGGEDPPALQRARVLAAEAALSRAVAELERTQAAQETLPVRQRLHEARRRNRERDVGLVQQRFDVLQQRVETFRARAVDARRQALLDEQAGIADAHPRLQDVASGNLDLLERLDALETRLGRARREAEETARQAAAAEDALRNTRSRLALGGTDEALGLVLLAERERLAQPRRLQRHLQETRRELAGHRLALLDLGDRLVGLDDFEATARVELHADEDGADPAQRSPQADEELQTALMQLLQARGQLLPELLETTQRLVTALAEHERALQQQLLVTTELTALLDQKLLWVPSHRVVDLAWLREHSAGWADLFKPSRFKTTWRLLRRAATAHWPVSAGALLVLVIGAVGWRHLPAALQRWAAGLRHVTSDRYRHTGLALMASLVAALPVPLAVAGLAWLLQNAGEAGRYSDSLGRALMSTVPLLYLHAFLGWLIRPHGLAAAHFRWPEHRLRSIAWLRPWLVAVVAPLQFALGLALVRNLDPALDTAGRDLMLVLSLVSGWLAWRLLAPDALWATQPDSGRHSLRRGLRAGVPAMAAVLAVLTLAGYLISANLMARNLWLTAGLLLVVAMLHGLLVRWLMLGERRLAMRRYLERRAAEAEDGREAATAAGEVVPEVEPDEIRLHSVNAQTRRLLRALLLAVTALGLYWIWSGMLPALGRLDEFVLWRVTSVDGTGAAVLDQVSLMAVLLGATALLATFVAARNLPGLVEIAMLSSTRIDAPTRYAITSISRYVIVITGVVIGFGLLGMRWSQLQWLAAALTVGLGFGLQEIFANFVSGLILLFERPFRVGDVITIGDVTGTVTRIRTRATTLYDFDNKEVVIPNKTFITGQLINWTLSDTRTRLTLKVGVAYGSDPGKVHQLLRQAADEHQLVLREPPPVTWFMSFGDSSLDFELRVFVGSMADRLTTISSLNSKITELFAAHGIEIAFPQLDLHVRDLPPQREGDADEDPDRPGPGPPPATGH